MDALAKSLVRTVVLKIGLIGNFSTYQKENDHPARLIFKKNRQCRIKWNLQKIRRWILVVSEPFTITVDMIYDAIITTDRYVHHYKKSLIG
jgi:hypothetical protein